MKKRDARSKPSKKLKYVRPSLKAHGKLSKVATAFKP